MFVVKYFIFTRRKRLRQVKYNPFQKEMQAFQQKTFQFIYFIAFLKNYILIFSPLQKHLQTMQTFPLNYS